MNKHSAGSWRLYQSQSGEVYHRKANCARNAKVVNNPAVEIYANNPNFDGLTMNKASEIKPSKDDLCDNCVDETLQNEIASSGEL